jgi:hypothetical protein
VPHGYVGVGVRAQAHQSHLAAVAGLILVILLLLFSISLLGGGGEKGGDPGVARVCGGGRGGSYRAALGFTARAQMSRAVMERVQRRGRVARSGSTVR